MTRTTGEERRRKPRLDSLVEAVEATAAAAVAVAAAGERSGASEREVRASLCSLQTPLKLHTLIHPVLSRRLHSDWHRSADERLPVQSRVRQEDGKDLQKEENLLLSSVLLLPLLLLASRTPRRRHPPPLLLLLFSCLADRV